MEKSMDAEPLSTAPLRANPVSPTAPAQATGTTQDSPQDRRVTKVKDPKKVTAGRKGAAARKAKQETLLEQLRKAKDGLRPADEVSQEETSPEHHVVKTADPTSELWTYAVLAGTAALALFAVAGTQRVHKNKTTAGPVGRRDGPIPAVEGKTAILDKRRDPFYMQ